MDAFLDWISRIIKKYNDIWNKVSHSTKNEIDSKAIYNKKFLKTKLNPYCDEAIDFSERTIPKVGSHYTCLAEILVGFIF